MAFSVPITSFGSDVLTEGYELEAQLTNEESARLLELEGELQAVC